RPRNSTRAPAMGTHGRSRFDRIRCDSAIVAVRAIEQMTNRRIRSVMVLTNWIPHIVTSTNVSLWASQVTASSMSARQNTAGPTERFVYMMCARPQATVHESAEQIAHLDVELPPR